MKWTSARKKIIAVFRKNESELMNADMVFQLLKEEGIHQSTIYRNLDFFVKEGVLGKTMVEQVAFYYVQQKVHHHYMICTTCKKKIKLDCQMEDFIQNVSKKYDFQVQQHDLILYGLCYSCRKKSSS